MVSSIAALFLAAVVLVAAYRYTAGRGRRVVQLFDRYPPHAPMADWSLRAEAHDHPVPTPLRRARHVGGRRPLPGSAACTAVS
ncbi:hypothetical protein [Nocardia vermiculata]|uniref:Uncharacterized protein n=1 Tax=Nocardia vermiculata TaxID=257274 RepID=A0A846Y3I9_9NOCA|nr:hypothetical protein [Nocardia vermiculata]NKY52542.1 hypothetical protein [Nocardia vermiculata]